MSAYNTPEKRQLLQEWRTANRALLNHPETAQHPACAFVHQRNGCPEWIQLANILGDLEMRMIRMGLPHPNNDKGSFVNTHFDPNLLA